MPVVVIGLSHHTAPVTVRERFAFAESRIPATLQSLRDSGIASEAVILSTCNRVELYRRHVHGNPPGLPCPARVPRQIPGLPRPLDR